MLGGILLVLLLGPLGFVIAICIGDNENKKGALIGVSIYAIVAVIGLIVALMIIKK